MAAMLRKTASSVFGRCDHCARHHRAATGNKINERERRLARKREERRWRREERV